MRKVLISILVCLLLIGTAFFMVNGMQKIKTEGFVGIDEKNDTVEGKIAELSNVITVTYSGALASLKTAGTTLAQSKTEYENKAIALNSNNSSYISQLEPYDIDYLWTKLGNYAKDESVVIKIDVTVSGISSTLYDLNFSVNGAYTDITDFIYDIENDSKLGFKIDNFTMTADTQAILLATFICKDIPINLEKLDTTTSSGSTSTTSSATTTEQSASSQQTSGNTTASGNTTTTGNTSSSSGGVAESYLGNDINPNKSNLTNSNSDYVIKTNEGN